MVTPPFVTLLGTAFTFRMAPFFNRRRCYSPFT